MSGVNVDCKIGTSNVTGRGIESGLLLSNRARTYLIYGGGVQPISGSLQACLVKVKMTYNLTVAISVIRTSASLSI